MDETQAESLESDAASTSVSSGAPSLRQVFTAPWIISQPDRAAVRMADGARLDFWLSFGSGILALAVLGVWLVMWDEAAGYTWWTSDMGYRSRQTYERSFGEVWQAWHVDRYVGPAELIFLSVVFAMPVATAIGAWLFLPNVHRRGRGWASYKRAYRAVASGIGLLVALTAAVGVPMVAMINWDEKGGNLEPEHVVPLVIFCLVCTCLLMYWLNRAARAVAERDVLIELPPRCEGCGYDLTHKPGDERCPECGLDTTQSLTPGVRRPGCEWQDCQEPAVWLSTTIAVIFSPTRFFGSLKLRLPTKEADRFALWTYVAIGIYAACVCLLIFTIVLARLGGAPEVFACFLPFLFFLLVPLICWSVHRIVGAVVTSWFIVRQVLPDARWARAVMAYETAYLWVFCLYSSGLLISFALFDTWVRRVAWMFRLDEPVVIFLGNCLLGLLWFLRYGIAYRNIRWSNY